MGDGLTFWEKQMLIVETQAAESRKKGGCLWCEIAENNHRRFKCILINDEGNPAQERMIDHAVQIVIADFCPKCGRFLGYQFKWEEE